MGRIQPNFGNAKILLILQVSGALPTTPTLWNNSTGNIYKFTDNVKGSSKGSKEVTETEYRTNDDALYDTKQEYKGIVSGFHYDRSQGPATFLETAVPAARAAGQKILCIFNMGYVSAKYKELFQVGVVNEQVLEEDDKPDSTFPVEHLSTPPVSALAITTTYLKAINTAVGAGSVQFTTVANVPAAPTVRQIKYT